MSSLRLSLAHCRQIALCSSRPRTLSSTHTSSWTSTPPYQRTTFRTILQLSRKEKALHAIQSTTGLLSEKEKQAIAIKEAKRAKFAERIQKKHGENWKAAVEEMNRVQAMNRAERAARLQGESPAVKKKNRWSQQRKDEHAAKKAEQRAAKEARKD